MDRATASKTGTRANKGYSFNFKPHTSSLSYQKNLITAQEMEANFVRSDDGGKMFRLKWFAILIVAVLSIGYLKYDVEYNIQPHTPDVKSDDSAVVDPVARKYYEQLKVPVEESVTDGDDGVPRALTDKEIRRERHRLRKAAEKAFEQQTVEHNALVHCDARREKQYNQMKIAYEKIHQKLDRNLYDVLGISQNEPANAQQLLQRVENLQKDIEAKTIAADGNEEDRQRELEDKEIALQDLRDAYDILSQPDSRVFYNLYGLRPPVEMKHVSARSGGWGQEFAFSRAYHVKMALAFLKYVDSYSLDVFALISCVLFVAFAMWRKYPELRAIAEKVEEHERRMKELAERAKTN
ncbi:molecular chaperones DnaJ [Perkinsela sp. CCAP 1560/4]|nr:molecular chaperones DnaJ [Perkinsela sp. CCAP 1560/4]|eukprot:KNH04451.1 molecular chaperones DnaJ [Perkinsela sp. CCAP 1560/4]